ncbi:hypothetical protein CPB86DRAFT_781813, partial [Serendipita vermifera]
MHPGDKLLCKCHRPVTRHQSRAQNSYGHYYYKCYKAFLPGSCKYFEWESPPSPPTTPEMSSTRRDEPNMPVTPSRRRLNDTSVFNDSPRRKRAIMEGLKGTSSDDETRDYQTADVSLRSPVRMDDRALSYSTGKKTAAVFETRSSSTAVQDTRRTGLDNTTIDEHNDWSDDQIRRSQSYLYRVNELKIKDRELKAKDKELVAKGEELEAKEEQIKALKEELKLLREERDYLSARASQHPSPSKPGMQTPKRRTVVEHTEQQMEPVRSHFSPILPNASLQKSAT